MSDPSASAAAIALASSIRAGRLGHAYIVEGAPELTAGFAEFAASAVLCPNAAGSDERTDDGDATGRPCGGCAHCRKVLAGIHPDVHTLDTGGREIKIDDIRAGLLPHMAVLPNEAARTALIVHAADNMNVFAQNALLAALEEPPPFVVFFLLCRSADQLLETVRSRCAVLKVESPGGGKTAEPPVKGAESAETPGDAAEPTRDFSADARELMKAAASGNELTLFTCLKRFDRLPRADMAALLDAAIELAGSMLRRAARASAGRTGSVSPAARQASAIIGRLRHARSMVDRNVLVGTVTAMLCAEIFDSMRG